MAALSDSEAELRRPKTVVEVSSRETAAHHSTGAAWSTGRTASCFVYHRKDWRGAACGSLSLVTLLGSVWSLNLQQQTSSLQVSPDWASTWAKG